MKKTLADEIGMRGNMELLAPAGSEAAFNAAMHNGADAIYLGVGLNHARQSSGGFTEASFFTCIENARVAGVRTYLTLNTLLTQQELEAAVTWADRAWQGGADAIIVQDVGLANRLHRLHPDMILHASTQMSIHNLEGVLAAQEAGLTRVVLARELSLQAIENIRVQTDMELEVFAHGSLCVCFSGQCLMSSLIGGRSGNRGMCAQPCRLPWKLSEAHPEGYLLSMKDLMTLQLLPQLQSAGVTSLKIEGRMKSPEYVAVVTGIYRKYLDLLAKDGPMRYGVDPGDEEALRQIFNRGGFTHRYLVGTNARSPVNRQASEKTVPAANCLVDPSHPKNLGVFVGTVLSWKVPYAEVKLTRDLAQGDGLEIHKGGKGGSRAVSTMLTAIMAKGKHEKQAFSGSTVFLGDVKEPVSAGDTVYRTSQRIQMQAASDMADHWQVHRVPLKMAFVMRIGEKASLTVEDESGRRVSVESETEVETARERALAAERVRGQLEKTGDAPWNLHAADIRIDGKGTLPVKEINAMRRMALERMTALRASGGEIRASGGEIHASGGEIHASGGEIPVSGGQIHRSDGNIHLSGGEIKLHPLLSCGPESLVLAFSCAPGMEWLRQARLAGAAGRILLMVPPVSRETMASMKSAFPGSIWIRTPTLLSDDRMDALVMQLEAIRPGLAGLSAGNPGSLRRLRQWAPELPILADAGMNLWNGEAIRQASEWGADMALLSPELTTSAMGAIKEAVLPLASWAYGRIPVMTMEHCPGSLYDPGDGRHTNPNGDPGEDQHPVSLSDSCDGHCGACARRTGTLTDRAGARFPYARDVFTDKTVVFHHRPLRWQENEWHPQAARLYAFITDEAPEFVSDLVHSLLPGSISGQGGTR